MSQKLPTEEINDLIRNRKLYTGFDEATYYRRELFVLRCKEAKDPYLLFKIKIFGYYKKTYKWTDEQCQYFIDNNIDDSLGYEVNGILYLYDWGVGYNNITRDKMHEPNLDHIIPKEQGGENTPENMRIRSRRLNENKGNTNSDQERYATIIDMIADMEDLELRNSLIEQLYVKYVSNQKEIGLIL
jgi:hypothetical protein